MKIKKINTYLLNRKIIICSTIFLMVITNSAFAFQAVWNKSFGSTTQFNAASGKEVAVHKDNRVVLTGVFQEAIDFGLGLHVAQSAQDIFLGLFDVNGVPLWSKGFGASLEKCPSETACLARTDVQSVIFDQLGNIVIIGYSEGNVDFGGGKIPAGSFLAKFDLQGNYLWSKSYQQVYFQGIAIDSKNNIIISGDQTGDQFNGLANLGCGNLATSKGSHDVLLANLTESGQCLWSKTWGGVSNDSGTRVVVDAEQNIVLAGNFDSSTINFGSTLQTTLYNWPVSSQVYTAKFDSSGNHLWSKKFGAGTLTDLAGNSAKEIILNGNFSGSNLNFGNGALFSNSGSVDIFVAKLDTQGNALWSRRYGGSANDTAKSVATLGDKIFITGSCVEMMSPISLSCMSGAWNPEDVFLMKLDGNGQYLKGRRFGDGADQIGMSIAVSAPVSPVYVFGSKEHIFAAGRFNNKLDFGISPILGSMGGEDAFLARFYIYELLFPKWNINDGPREPRYTGCPLNHGTIVIPLEGNVSEKTFRLVEPTRFGSMTVNYDQQQLEYIPASDFVGTVQATFSVTDMQTGNVSYVTFTFEMVKEEIAE